MLKKVISAALLASLATASQAGTEFLPVLNDDYKAAFALAFIAGKTDVQEEGIDSITAKGVELSMMCPLVKPANHSIRQQISLVKTDEDGIKMTSFDLSPHHMWKVSDKLSVGIGPSLGATKVETVLGDDTAFTYGVGTSARLDLSDKLFIAADARYIWSKDFDIADIKGDIERTRVMAKIGYQF